jgi:predicted Zn-dependent protease
MRSSIWLLLVCLANTSLGCLPLEMQKPTTLVPTNPLTPTTQGPEVAKEMSDEARRVVEVGQKLLAANPNLQIKPTFMLLGKPEVEIFHQGNQAVMITEGLVKQCTSEGQLAAVLSMELARMVVERLTIDQFSPRNADTPPPMDLRIHDYSGAYGSDDGAQLALLAKWEAGERERFRKRLSPELLAQQYLAKANYPGAALEEVAPLLKSAEGQTRLETQFTNAKPKQY